MTDDSDPEVQTATPAVWGPGAQRGGLFDCRCVRVALLYDIFPQYSPRVCAVHGPQCNQTHCPGNNLIPVSIGKYHAEGSNATIEEFNDDEAILALLNLSG